MTIFNDFLHFFFNILGNKHPNNTNTGIRISQMNFLAHENVETHPPGGRDLLVFLYEKFYDRDFGTKKYDLDLEISIVWLFSQCDVKRSVL